MWQTIQNHPAVSAGVGSVLFFAAVWPLFSSEIVPAFLANRGWLLTMPSWYYAMVAALGFAVVAFQIVLIRLVRRSNTVPSRNTVSGADSIKPSFKEVVTNRDFINETVDLDGKL